jgi:hypothetical protein
MRNKIRFFNQKWAVMRKKGFVAGALIFLNLACICTAKEEHKEMFKQSHWGLTEMLTDSGIGGRI